MFWYIQDGSTVLVLVRVLYPQTVLYSYEYDMGDKMMHKEGGEELFS